MNPEAHIRPLAELRQADAAEFGGTQHVVYRDTDDLVHELWCDAEGWHEKVLSEAIPHEVDSFEVSFDAYMIAFTTHEAGSSVLRFIDLAMMKEMPRPPLQYGVISGLEWRRNSTEIGFSITSARSAGDVFSYDVDANKLTRNWHLNLSKNFRL